MYCSRCGAANPDDPDVAFCRSCGGDLNRAGAVSPAEESAPSASFSPVRQFATDPGFETINSGAGPSGPVVVQAAVFPYGGFWIRLVGWIIDSIALSIMSFTVSVAIVLIATLALRGQNGVEEASAVAYAISLLLGFIYFVIFPPLLGATPGKLAIGYHIVGADGRHIGFGRAFVRAVGQYLSAIVLCLGYIWIAADSRKQGWHDKIAGTYVLRKELVQY